MTEMTLEQLTVYFGHVADLFGHYDPQSILEKLRNKLVASVQANFAGKHSPDGVPWKPILDRSHPPLRRTDNLAQAAIEAAWHSLRSDSLTIDTSLLPAYWHYQQEGTRTIPERPFIGVPESLVEEGERLLIEDVQSRMLPD